MHGKWRLIPVLLFSLCAVGRATVNGNKGKRPFAGVQVGQKISLNHPLTDDPTATTVLSLGHWRADRYEFATVPFFYHGERFTTDVAIPAIIFAEEQGAQTTALKAIISEAVAALKDRVDLNASNVKVKHLAGMDEVPANLRYLLRNGFPLEYGSPFTELVLEDGAATVFSEPGKIFLPRQSFGFNRAVVLNGLVNALGEKFSQSFETFFEIKRADKLTDAVTEYLARYAGHTMGLRIDPADRDHKNYRLGHALAATVGGPKELARIYSNRKNDTAELLAERMNASSDGLFKKFVIEFSDSSIKKTTKLLENAVLSSRVDQPAAPAQ